MRKIFLEFIKQSDGDIDAAIQSFTRYFPKAEMESIFPGFSIEAVTSGSEQKKKPKIYAQGGRAGYNTGMLVEEEQDMVEEEPVKQAEKQQAMPLTYDQLRARLPQSIGDDIVRLLADNYDALGDFAAIQTQADVDNFNLKLMSKILIFDKGGRNQRISLIKKNKAPKDFFQSIDFLRSRNFSEILLKSLSLQVLQQYLDLYLPCQIN